MRQGKVSEESGDTWIFPHGSMFNIPPPCPLESCPFQFGCSEHSWLGHLIKNAHLHDATI